MNDFMIKDKEAVDLRFYMDESSAPYEEDENPFERTKEDEEFDKYVIDKFNLVTKDD